MARQKIKKILEIRKVQLKALIEHFDAKFPSLVTDKALEKTTGELKSEFFSLLNALDTYVTGIDRLHATEWRWVQSTLQGVIYA